MAYVLSFMCVEWMGLWCLLAIVFHEKDIFLVDFFLVVFIEQNKKDIAGGRKPSRKGKSTFGQLVQ